MVKMTCLIVMAVLSLQTDNIKINNHDKSTSFGNQ